MGVLDKYFKVGELYGILRQMFLQVVMRMLMFYHVFHQTGSGNRSCFLRHQTHVTSEERGKRIREF